MTESILQIVDGAYAAACGEAAWEQVLAKICRLGGLDGAALSTLGATEPRRVALAAVGLAARHEPRAWHGAMAGDPASVDRILRSPPGTVLRDRPIMSAAFATPARWTGGAPGRGPTAWACVIVGKDGRRVVCLELQGGHLRAAGSPEPDELLRQLAPHLVRAWRLGMAGRPAAAMPLRIASRSPADADQAPAAEVAGLPAAARLRLEFGLTKAEARLALRLAAGSSLASAAQAFDVQLSTLRSQL